VAQLALVGGPCLRHEHSVGKTWVADIPGTQTVSTVYRKQTAAGLHVYCAGINPSGS